MEPTPRWPTLIPDLIARHRVLDLKDLFWFKRPVKVRIALYAEGTVAFQGGSFEGLQHVVAALRSDPWPWVIFEPVLIHRNSDPSADLQNKTLDQIHLETFDELWLFGIAEGNLLSAAEVNAVNAFMDAGGGVLHTGDHASLGKGIAGNLKRAGKMRRYPAPQAAPGVWNNTLRSGADSVYEFVDQSDDYPQDIRLRRYWEWTFYPSFFRHWAPHPVLCGNHGPIRIFPDHQHEGEAIAPNAYPAADWPSKGGYQPQVDVVAWGRIESPDANTGREFGLVSVYNGHDADVGRIVADSTWHHWFDINLKGFATGHLETIERYFLNVAAWLAPADKQYGMRNGVFLIALRRDPLVMIDATVLPPWYLGGLARDALGQFAPQCLVRQWILDLVKIPVLVKMPPFTQPDPPPFDPRHPVFPYPLPLTDLLMASVITPLIEAQRDITDLVTEMKPEIVERAFAGALRRTAEIIGEQAKVMQLGQVADLLGQREPPAEEQTKKE